MQIETVTGTHKMIELGQSLAATLKAGEKVWLQGDQGSGKTTLVQGILKGLGYNGAVTSPTYTLLEPYDLNELSVVHMDLYRLESPDELEMLGFRAFVDSSLCLIEWPEKGVGFLPHWDVRITINTLTAESREVRVEKS